MTENNVITNFPLDDFGSQSFEPVIAEVSLLTEEDELFLPKEEKVEEVNKEEESELIQVVETKELNPSINLDEYTSKYLGDEYLSEVIVQDEDGNEIPAKDYIKDVDSLLEIVTLKYENELEKVKTSSISTENLDNLQKEIIDIVSKGGNPLEMIAIQKQYMEPLSTIDIETEEGQAEIVYSSLVDQGVPEDTIDFIIEGYKKKGVLEDKAIECKEQLKKSYEDRIEQVRKQEEDRLIKIQEDHKKYVKELKQELKTLEFNDKTIQQYVKYATEIKQSAGENSNARMTDMDAAYLERRNDPKRAIELMFFLNDTETYNKMVSKKEVTKTHLDTAKKVVIAKSKSSSSIPKSNNGSKDNDVLATVPI